MKARYRRLQSLMTPLRVLEAAARQGNFTKAAEELGITQPSVSRHIANLEQDLGATLFLRDHNKVALTEEGSTLANSVDLGLSHILSTIENVSASQPRNGLTLACTHSFAHGWLLPRFSSLRRATRDTPINLVVSYWLKDIVIDDVDLIIGWRADGFTDWPRMRLFDEIIYPVCAPAYLAEHPEISRPHALTQTQLLDYDIWDDDQLGWAEWFADQGIAFESRENGYLFSNYHFMIQAAMDGEGVALGWHHLVADQIEQGRLDRVGSTFNRAASTYALEYRQDRIPSATVAPVLDWFRKQARELTHPK